MDQSPDKSDDAKAAFRKPSNDTANRKYRRRSSTSPSPPPPVVGSSERGVYSYSSREDTMRNNDDGRRREKDKREPDQTTGSGRHAKGGDLYRYDRSSSRGSRGYRGHDDYKDDKDRDRSKITVKASYDSRDSRDHNSGRVRNENEYKRSRDGEKYSHSRYIDDGDSYMSKHTERKNASLYTEKEKDVRKWEKDACYENRGNHMACGDNRTGRSSYDDAKAGRSDSTLTYKGSGCGTNESGIADYRKSTREDKNRFDYRETKLTTERDSRGSRDDNEDDFGYRTRRPGSPSKKPKLTSPGKSIDVNTSELSREAFSKATTLPNSGNDVDNTNDVDAAKVAALRAAELVNKNLVGVGVVGALSTDQKKKLLWGSKKKAVEETGHCWDVSLFPDREQQEKFNRLMGVKGEVKVEQKAGNPEGKTILDPEKQKELQLDLEKQYTAGLRRRDGRTVGLGL